MIPGGVLIAVAFMLVSYYYSKRYGYGRLASRSTWHERGKAFWEAKWALMVPVIVLGGIYGGVTTPTEAGGIAVVYSLFVECVITKKMTWKLAENILMSSLRSTGMIFLIVIGALVLGQILVYFHADAIIAGYITGITTNSYILMGIFIVLFMMLGCFMEVSSAILLMTPVLMPIVHAVGINPVHFGVVFVTTIVCGVITPPVGINLFVACTMTDIPFSSVCTAARPFICAMLGVAVLIAFFPQICLIML
jgi:C4-dicarboxylate transporter DctM subunit